ncbi:DUF1345 domain-containing protein [Pedobacter nanyangensis]|uniref:DUF1345 domain-containing protein n=1 Tax=Pedobacter nanyangensis TaxID=1562389 RepID=UPI000DE2DCC9|nr:DUF1345 domain-containing protein [Pedobacter nanyangensis]
MSLELKRIHHIKAAEHLGISLVVAVMVYFFSAPLFNNFLSRIMLSWITFCTIQTGISWLVFVKSSAKQTRQHAGIEDGGRAIVSLTVLLATFAGMMAVFILLIKTDNSSKQWIDVLLGMVGMFLSWILVHTSYTSRYAHLYYDVKAGKLHKGLVFPGDEAPDFIDFAYHSFVIGMTFQVSDIDITSKRMRRLTLGHSLISFVFNTCIVALTISAVAGLFG